MNSLWESFLGADFRPVGLTAGSRALVRVVDDLGFLADRITDDTGRQLGDLKPPLVRVLRDCAAVLSVPEPSARAARGTDLNSALAELRSIAQGRYREDILEILECPTTRPPWMSGESCWGDAPSRPPSV